MHPEVDDWNFPLHGSTALLKLFGVPFYLSGGRRLYCSIIFPLHGSTADGCIAKGVWGTFLVIQK
jgi:hypothetical protein